MIAAILGFSLLIISHELGHFFAARLSGIAVLEFSVGMGPKVFSINRKGTDYSLRILPIGGYVRMEGDEDGMEPPSGDESAATAAGIPFPQASVGRRAFTMISGPAMNIITAIFAMTLLVSTLDVIPSTTVASYKEDNVSGDFGLVPGDRIVSVGDDKIHISSDIVYAMMRSGGAPLDLTVEREGQLLTLPSIAFPSYEDQGIVFSIPDFYCTRLDITPATVVRESCYRCVSIVREVYSSIVGLLRGEIPVSQLSGPFATTQAIGEAAKQGFESLIYFMVFISINIGMINLMPFPALDGGRLVLLALELVRGRPMRREAEGWINFAGFAALMVLIVYVTFQDILKLIG